MNGNQSDDQNQENRRANELETYREHLFRLAEQMLAADGVMRSKLSASDLAQQAIISACGSYKKFRGKSEKELVGWLESILKNKYIDQYRRFKSAAKRDVQREVALNDQPGESDALPDDENTPRGILYAVERRQAVVREIESLPTDQRSVIRMRVYDAESFESIARTLGLSLSRVRKLYADALSNLSDRLKAHGEEPDD